MRCLRVLCFILCIFVSVSLCAAGTPPSCHGVEGSYKANCDSAVNPAKPLIILDPGHGGHDEGAKVNAFMEKRLTLATALMVKKHLEKMNYRVIMTRGHDVYLPLQRRVAIANRTKGALFVSVHFNSSPSAEAKGVEIFYFDSKEQWRTRASRRLANCILFRIVDQTDAVSRDVVRLKTATVKP